MANNGNKMVDCDINCTKQTDCFVYRNIPNATDGGPSTSKSHKSLNKMLKHLIRSTVRLVQSRKKIFNRKQSVGTSCKSEEQVATCSSSIVDNIIKPEAKAVAKQEMMNAITSTTRFDQVFDGATHENPAGDVGPFVRGASYRYAEYTAKYADNTVPECGCGPLRIGTQSDTVDGEFSLKTSPDAFAKACEERRHADFILEEIAKVSDDLMEKARLVSAKEQASILASVSVSSAGYEMGEETFESPQPLISSIVCGEKKPTAAVMQPETLTNTQLVFCSSRFAPALRKFSACLGKSLSISDSQVISPAKCLRRTEHARTVSVMYPERDDVLDAAVTTVAEEKNIEESSKKISLGRTSDKRAAVDKTNCATVIRKCIPKLRKKVSTSLDLNQQNDIQITASKRETLFSQEATTVKNGIVDSSIKTSQVRDESMKVVIAKDILQESVPCGRPKYRAKYRIDASMTKERKMPQFKKTCTPKDTKKLPKCERLFLPLPETIKCSRSLNYLKRPAIQMYQDCRGKPLGYPQPMRHCEDLIPSDVCLGRPKYCVWPTPCFGSRNEVTRDATLSHAHCAFPQDSCAIEYRSSCHSLVNNHASSRYCNISDCAKRWATCENLLCINTYWKNDAKYCYPHLNNIDNICTGYYHWNDNCPVWNNQHCGRDRSYYWTKGNLYFTHPWPSEHLLRYN